MCNQSRSLAIILALIMIPVLCASSRYSVATQRCESRRTEVVNILAAEGVKDPDFFYFLALAESTCKDEAVSRSGAKSMWQMMPWLIGNNDPLDWRLMTQIAGRYIASIQSRQTVIRRQHVGDNSISDNWITVAGWNTGFSNLRRGCPKLTHKCVAERFPEAAALANTVTKWSKL